jgi:hypothetical protein
LELARVMLAAVYVVLVQAILRHPLVAVFGPEAEPFIVEAAFAMLALLAVLFLLGWAYAVGKPLLEGMTWVALDTAFATSSDPPAEVAPATTNETDTVTAVAPRTQTAPRVNTADVPTHASSDPTQVRR